MQVCSFLVYSVLRDLPHACNNYIPTTGGREAVHVHGDSGYGAVPILCMLINETASKVKEFRKFGRMTSSYVSINCDCSDSMGKTIASIQDPAN